MHPAMRQHAVDIAIEHGRQTCQYVGEPGVGFMAIGFGGNQQAHDRGSALASGLGASKQPILAFQSNGSDGIFGRIIVDQVGTVPLPT